MIKAVVTMKDKIGALAYSIVSIIVLVLFMLLNISCSIVVKATAISYSTNSILTVFITFASITAVTIAFSIYSMCFGNSIFKTIYLICVILFDLIILMTSVSLFSMKPKYIAQFRDLWERSEINPIEKNKTNAIEKQYQCCGYENNTFGTDCIIKDRPCQPLLEFDLNVLILIAGIISAILFVVLSINIAVSIWTTVTNRNNGTGKDTQNDFSSDARYAKPIGYGF